MEKQTFGQIVSELRKEKGMTQLELAEKMGVTDKAVSKWERDLSFPDVNSIPKLAEIFDVSVNDLIQAKTSEKNPPLSNRIGEIIDTCLKAVALAMGIATTVLSYMNKIEVEDAIELLGLGLACLAISLFDKKD